jgi:hypothetical protein
MQFMAVRIRPVAPSGDQLGVHIKRLMGRPYDFFKKDALFFDAAPADGSRDHEESFF